MGIRAVLAKPFAAYVDRQTRQWAARPEVYQHVTMLALVAKAAGTLFGRDHHFDDIQNYDDFRAQVPVGDYEALKPYVARVLQGEHDILWPGQPAYFAKTSGTTSGTKYIPVSHDLIVNHIHGARNALLSYVHETGHASVPRRFDLSVGKSQPGRYGRN